MFRNVLTKTIGTKVSDGPPPKRKSRKVGHTSQNHGIQGFEALSPTLPSPKSKGGGRNSLVPTVFVDVLTVF